MSDEQRDPHSVRIPQTEEELALEEYQRLSRIEELEQMLKQELNRIAKMERLAEERQRIDEDNERLKILLEAARDTNNFNQMFDTPFRQVLDDMEEQGYFSFDISFAHPEYEFYERTGLEINLCD